MRRHEFLAGLHRVVQPRRYFEIGVNKGASMRLSRAQSIGVDPAYNVVNEIRCDLHLARVSSDEFFARDDALGHLDEPNVDLAFIDGLHFAEFALRDFINIEKICLPTSVVVIDDSNPRRISEAARYRITTLWAGDVYKVVQVLREHRPDLTVFEVGTSGTGVAMILGVDAASRVLHQVYDEIAVGLCTPDPQAVPQDVIDRSRSVEPKRLLASNYWARLRAVREQRPDTGAVRRLIDESNLPAVPRSAASATG